jgi:predicted metal-binding protein
MAATLHVCITCRAGQPVYDGEARPGTMLYDALKGADLPSVTILPVECLSACDHGCAVALQAPGAWGYVYCRMSPEDAPAILEGAAKYAASADGIVPWRERPEIFRKRSLARIPPLPQPEAAE